MNRKTLIIILSVSGFVLLVSLGVIIYFASSGESKGDKDSDGDGVSDSIEYELGTDSYTMDTDGDGLSDYEELTPGNDWYFTDPLVPDEEPPSDDHHVLPPPDVGEEVIPITRAEILAAREETLAAGHIAKIKEVDYVLTTEYYLGLDIKKYESGGRPTNISDRTLRAYSDGPATHSLMTWDWSQPDGNSFRFNSYTFAVLSEDKITDTFESETWYESSFYDTYKLPRELLVSSGKIAHIPFLTELYITSEHEPRAGDAMKQTDTTSCIINGEIEFCSIWGTEWRIKDTKVVHPEPSGVSYARKTEEKQEVIVFNKKGLPYCSTDRTKVTETYEAPVMSEGVTYDTKISYTFSRSCWGDYIFGTRSSAKPALAGYKIVSSENATRYSWSQNEETGEQELWVYNPTTKEWGVHAY